MNRLERDTGAMLIVSGCLMLAVLAYGCYAGEMTAGTFLKRYWIYLFSGWMQAVGGWWLYLRGED
jgi:hypothetical protein